MLKDYFSDRLLPVNKFRDRLSDLWYKNLNQEQGIDFEAEFLGERLFRTLGHGLTDINTVQVAVVCQPRSLESKRD